MELGTVVASQLLATHEEAAETATEVSALREKPAAHAVQLSEPAEPEGAPS